MSKNLKKTRNLRKNKKGYSGILESIFLILIILFLYFGVFLYMEDQNNSLYDATAKAETIDLERTIENIVISNPLFTVSSDHVAVRCTINNTSPLTVELARIFLIDETTGIFGNSTLSISINPGQAMQFSRLINIEGATTEHQYMFWLVTKRGTVAMMPTHRQTTIKSVTQSIGSILMNFNDFKYYNITQEGSTGPYSLDFPGEAGYFVNFDDKESEGIAFSVNVMNMDPYERNITLSEKSVLFSIFHLENQVQQIRGALYYLTNVTQNTIYTNTPKIELPYGEPVTIYFASTEIIQEGNYEPGFPGFYGTAPINLALIGTVDTETTSTQFGQNIPYVSIKFSTTSLPTPTSIIIDPTSGPKNDDNTITITGEGFTPNSQLTITVNGKAPVSITPSPAATDSNGDFSDLSVTFRAGPNENIIQVTDETGKTATATFTGT